MTVSRKWLLALFRAESMANYDFESCMEYIRNSYLVHAAGAYAFYQEGMKAVRYAVKKIDRGLSN